jgi:DNA-directed RNA polymerase
MKQKLVESIKRRLIQEIAPQNPVKFLFDVPVEEMIDSAITFLYLYTRGGRGGKKLSLMTEIVSGIGHSVRNKHRYRKDSALAAKAGGFILWSLEEAGICKAKLGIGPSGHGTYVVEITDEDALNKLWESLSLEKTEKLPSETPYAPWDSVKHETGPYMIKTQDKNVLASVSPETHPMLFECLNKAQATGWKVNEDIYHIFTWALRNKADAFADIWEIQNPESKSSKIREARAVGSIAKRFLGKTFYHLYYYDFRGRKYPATAYFHEQGTDASKGMLLRADSKAIGEQGFIWLLISIASNWAGDAGRDDGYKTDKIPLNDRAQWSLDNKEILLSYADNPKVNQGWMKADKPWQFLAACNEWLKIELWERQGGDPFEFVSSLECFIDGSNNGSQHLSALTKDEITAPHVNLVPLDLPGDLYKYVADHVWAKIEKKVASMSKEEVKQCESFIDTLIDMKIRISEAPQKSDRRKQLVEEILAFKREHNAMIAKSSPVFWNRVKDPKHRRKIVKRNVMTLPYGGTAYGLGQQQIDDARKHGIDALMTMEHKWGAYMGREVFEDCKISLARPMRLLSVFEEAGAMAEAEGRFLSWTAPITNFPVVQHYTEGATKKIWVQYGPGIGERNSSGYFENTLQLHVCFIEDMKPSTRKQSQGASPNAIHSLDAAHLTVAVCRAPFNVTTIHDSFGCLLGDMPELYIIIRETFVELYNTDPLTHMMKQIGGDISKVEIGNLDISLVIDSEYCFA